MKITYFKEQLQLTNARAVLLQKNSNKISIARLVFFCLTIAAASLGYDHQNTAAYFITAFFIGVFFCLIQKHRKLRYQLAFLESKQEILQNILNRSTNQWHTAPETGKRYLCEKYPPGKDLDIFGKNSLFQYLCSAYTSDGKKELAQWLCVTEPNPAEIIRRQQAVAELSQQKDFALHMQTLGNLFAKANKNSNASAGEEFLAQIEQSSTPPLKAEQFLAFILPLLTLSSVALATCGKIGLITPILFIFLQFFIFGICYGRTQCLLSPLFHFYRQLKQHQQMLALIENTAFSSPYLKELQQTLKTQTKSSLAIQQLSKIGECVSMRYNFIFLLLGNALLLWDFHCIRAFVNWKYTHGQDVRLWLQIIGKYEALISLSMISHTQEKSVFPKILTGSTPSISGTDFFHPLIESQQVVANSVHLQAQTCIITGSNMSGKTTFLRNIGINCILAYAGAPVCAKQFSLSGMRIFTSMRIEDDLSKGISTFYAELLRIKTMVQYTDRQCPQLSLIDEIFKGTNSADRIIGATATIKKLTNAWNLTLVSTHDFELCNLADQQNNPVVNYHFAEFYQDDQIYFDYKIKEGRSQSTNAKYLLHMAGIL